MNLNSRLNVADEPPPNNNSLVLRLTRSEQVGSLSDQHVQQPSIEQIQINLSFTDNDNNNISHTTTTTTLPLASQLLLSPIITQRDYTLPLVSVCLCMKNAATFIDETLLSVLAQTYQGPIELSIYDDVSTDGSYDRVKRWFNSQQQQQQQQLTSGGCGYARNRSIEYSHGQYLCILDADDIMFRERIYLQLKECLDNADKHLIVGANFIRIPDGSSTRYTNWCNSMDNEQLHLHQYRECTIIQPTWFMKRTVYDRNGPFTEPSPEVYSRLYSVVGPGTSEQVPTSQPRRPIPEDLLFFHRHLDQDGQLRKVHQPLVIYRYHPDNLSKQIHRLVLFKIKLEHLERRVLSNWQQFSIWGAGRDGKKFFTMLSDANKDKVAAFCDVDVNKIGKKYNAAYTNHMIPIVHFSQAPPPFILCVALDRTNMELENNIKSLNLREGIDYWQFN
ncbi:hypothetical protein SAMD00019534_043780 [Acytostelium subglobosum LB1]|uniref:hypothetical protein n=1 Tax=Acytostelium subglobosum LB1 TaxID=1410327 RepID=UPI0006451234|nr:hypothetical protein SAMD00019534_043780 [Acytostelium subglobosum LB1]GAM21203.1 hypothetical protein SAMD00019534_043780 [Acytostelium subglobosum LB1]|eukprot:XP_012756337.1 hypothetical protein SAMD00019534_043780 [Acytostelium subglobosum LB1]